MENLMQRRTLLSLPLMAAPVLANAHHGWSSFDQTRPVYLRGTTANVAWRNPHAEFDLLLTPDLALPADFTSTELPAQTASVDRAALLKNAKLPSRGDKKWQIELAPLTRLAAWKVPEIKNGETLSVLGFTFAEEKGEPILRAEYLFLRGVVYGLRSAPA
jgi:hypothetical protein